MQYHKSFHDTYLKKKNIIICASVQASSFYFIHVDSGHDSQTGNADSRLRVKEGKKRYLHARYVIFCFAGSGLNTI